MNEAAGNQFASDLARIGAGSVRMVDTVESVKLLDQVARQHIADATARYWWSSLKGKQSVSDYGNDTEAWAEALDLLLGGMDGEEVFLAITDDEDGPWPVVAVDKRRLRELIGELPFFEYFVFERNCSRVIFDTHNNTFVVSSHETTHTF